VTGSLVARYGFGVSQTVARSSHDQSPGSGPRRRDLFAEYARNQGPVGVALAVFWSLLAVALVILLVLFDTAQLMYGQRGGEAILLTILIIGLLWLLSVVEGSELAVARLLHTDPRHLPATSAGQTLERVQREPKTFFNGRQALVVTSIVVLTLSVAQIAKLHRPPVGPGDHLVWFLRSWPIQLLFVFGFPNFIVLWISQLYPKLRAASDAPGRFMLASYQAVVRACMWIERTTRLGAPTSVLGIVRDRELLTGVAADAVAMEPLPDDQVPDGPPPAKESLPTNGDAAG